MHKILMTKEGFDKLKAELKILKDEERPAIIKAIATAREHGDLSENAEYHSAKERQGIIEGKIKHLESIESNAEVIDTSKMSSDKVRFGATVTLEDENGKTVVYKLVSEYESDVERGMISVVSPLARAIIGKMEDDEVEVKTPSGIKDYAVVKIEYK